MTQPILPQIAGLMTEMRALGTNLLDWRADTKARHLHSKADLKTEADRRAHQHLVAALARDFPDIPVISEEDAEHLATRPERYWLIDPIDGTASWLNGFAGFVIQIALIEGTTPVLGLIHAPALDLFYTAARGEGAFVNGTALDPLRPRASVILIDNTPTPHGICARLMDQLSTTGYVESGSLGLKSCRIADGVADLFVKDVVVRDWDMAPAHVLLGELGGEMIGMDGQPFAFEGAWDKPGGVIVARNAAIAEQGLAAIARLNA